MAATQLSVMFLAVLASLLGVGLVLTGLDRATRVLFGAISAVLWGGVSISSFSVYAEAWTGTQALTLYVYLGLAMAALTFVVMLYQVALLVGDSTDATAATLMSDT